MDRAELVLAFVANFDRYDFAQPVVAEAIGANMTDLNTWRSRGFVTLGVDEGSRIYYTGRGLIHAGIVNELAAHFGPKRAAFFSQQLVNEVSKYALGSPGDRIIDFQRPINVDGSPSEISSDMHLVMRAYEDFKAGDLSRTRLYFPIDRLVDQWMVMAQMIKARRAA